VIVGVTGHRPDKLGDWDPLHPVVTRVRKALRDGIIKNWPAKLLTGMAQGVDQWVAEACIELGIPFVACLPCDNQCAPWPLPTQQRWRKLCEKAVEVIIVSPGPYKPWKMQRRNEYIVDHCERLLAVHDGSEGGTYNCLVYAQSVKREIVHLPWQGP
jgi:uncharacterized phage-like protein YoqJ